MTNEELTNKVVDLEKQIKDLQALFAKNNFTDLQIFTKKVQFNSNAKINNLEVTAILKTAGTAPIADGNHTITIPNGGGSVVLATKNGIITSIS